MTLDELDQFLSRHQDVEWAFDDDGNLFLRHSVFDTENEKVKVEPKALKELSAQDLEKLLVSGRNVEHITRVTGYFSRVSGWNKGKLGELVDRSRVGV